MVVAAAERLFESNPLSKRTAEARPLLSVPCQVRVLVGVGSSVTATATVEIRGLPSDDSTRCRPPPPPGVHLALGHHACRKG